MISVFYISAIVAILASFKVITSVKPLSALLYLVITLLALAVIFFALGAHFSAALVVILFVGAVSILFISSINFLNLGKQFAHQEALSLTPKVWLGPLVLAFVLLVVMLYGLSEIYLLDADNALVAPTMGMRDMLLGPYILVIELAVLLILGALVVAYHFVNKLHASHDETAVPATESVKEQA